MLLAIREIHVAPAAEALNQEWLLVENAGPVAFNARGCAVTAHRGKAGRPRQIGTLDPGFTIKAGERVRIVTGNPQRKAQGEPPAEGEGTRNYFLFMRGSILEGPGTTLRLVLKQLEVARAVYDPAKESGVAE